MNIPVPPPETIPAIPYRVWQIRLLGAAIGATLSLILTLVGIPTLILAFIGIVGIPVGALIGALSAPRVVATRTPGQLAAGIGLIAAPIGTLTYVVLAALGEGSGATPAQILGLVPMYFLYFGLYGLLFGTPITLLVAFIAVRLLRRLSAWAHRLWILSIIVLVVLLTPLAAGLVVATILPHQGGDQAAYQGNQVAFEYAVLNKSPNDYMLDIRSYWKGEVAGGSSSGSLGACSATSGSDWLQAGDWAIYLIPGMDAEWQDRPSGTPVIRAADWQAEGPVRLTIIIDTMGQVSVLRGQADQATGGAPVDGC